MIGKGKLEETLRDNVPSSSEQIYSRYHHVFLSFRGSDTINNFTSHLYDRLESLGFNVYKDDKKMIKGEEINEDLKRAISNSRICIPIFSRTYASSKACLWELYHMIRSKSKIIPIFYDVTPDDVKLKTPLYRSALEEHRHSSKLGLDQVDKWENALLMATEKAGFDIVNKNEAEEITSITQELVNQIMPKNQDLTNHLVEIDDEIHCVETLLDLSADGFRIIGVFGMGGIGKTTLAKLIFNRHCSEFSNCCSFLSNVRESLESKRLVELQRQLCKDIIDPSLANSIADSNDGINKIKNGLENKKVLLVLDDMDSASQLADLVGHHVSFTSGSRIIITTRNKRILDVLKQDMNLLAYELKEMDYDRAIKLFSRNAFRRNFPPKEFQTLSEQAVSYIKGIPLALEVFGSSLCGRGKEEWEEKLEELKNIPEKSLQNRLMISYQGLKYNEQKIFLDIACYYGELNKMHACYMWQDCGWFPKSTIQALKDRSLIKVIVHDGGEILWMHDILKHLGRTIIQEESDKSGGILSRLQINESLDILHEKKENMCVEMLSISNATITRESMAGLCKLRFLELRNCTVKGDFKGLFPDLRWFSVRDVSYFKPINFEPKNLVVLSLFGANIVDLPDSNVTELPDSVGQLEKMKELRVIRCDRLKRVPELPSSLTHLCIQLENETIQVCWSPHFKLTNIIELELSCHCAFPSKENQLSFEWIGSAANLERLCLQIPYIITNLEKVAELSRLKHLTLHFAKFQDLQHFPSSLFYLELQNCEFLSGVLDVSNLKNLDCLRIWGDDHLELINVSGELRALWLVGCSKLKHIHALGDWKGLESLELLACPSLVRLPDLSKSRKLKHSIIL